jgi:hypothetical protein
MMSDGINLLECFVPKIEAIEARLAANNNLGSSDRECWSDLSQPNTRSTIQQKATQAFPT